MHTYVHFDIRDPLGISNYCKLGEGMKVISNYGKYYVHYLLCLVHQDTQKHKNKPLGWQHNGDTRGRACSTNCFMSWTLQCQVSMSSPSLTLLQNWVTSSFKFTQFLSTAKIPKMFSNWILFCNNSIFNFEKM